MGGVARILLRHVRSEQKDWMEIGKFDGETVRICDGLKGKICKNKHLLTKIHKAAYKIYAPLGKLTNAGYWRGLCVETKL